MPGYNELNEIQDLEIYYVFHCMHYAKLETWHEYGSNRVMLILSLNANDNDKNHSQGGGVFFNKFIFDFRSAIQFLEIN